MVGKIKQHGISGTVQWSIDDEGLMLFEPVNGNEGTLADSKREKSNHCYSREWEKYRFFIKKIEAIGRVYLPENSMGMFSGCAKLASIDLSHFDTSKVTEAQFMFYCCRALKSLNVSNFDTSKVVDMSNMFEDCWKLTSLDLSHFNTENVKNMDNMFHECESLKTLDLSGFDTSNVTSMSFMFSGCSSLTSLDLSHFDMSKVTDMGYMFHGCGELVNLDLTGLKDFEGKGTSCILDNCDSLSNLSLSENVEKATNDLILLHTILYYTPSSFLLSHERIQVANVLLRYFEEWLNIDLSKEKELLKSITKKEDINGITAWKSETHPVKKSSRYPRDYMGLWNDL